MENMNLGGPGEGGKGANELHPLAAATTKRGILDQLFVHGFPLRRLNRQRLDLD
jgi:hypothetical protein